MAAFTDIQAQASSMFPDGGIPSGTSIMNLAGQLICGRSGALFSIDSDQAEAMDEADRDPVNEDLDKTTRAPTTTAKPSLTTATPDTTSDPALERLKDRECVRETCELD